MLSDTNIPVILEMTRDVDCWQLRRYGLLPVTCYGRFASGRVSLRDLPRLQHSRLVKRIRCSGAPTNPEAVSDIRTIVAVIDQGFRLDDESLWDQSGCRILSYWDQTAKSGHGPSCFHDLQFPGYIRTAGLVRGGIRGRVRHHGSRSLWRQYSFF